MKTLSFTGFLMALAFAQGALGAEAFPTRPVRVIAPISLVTSAPYLLVASPAVPVTSVKELIQVAKAKPGALTYGSGGNGTAGHLGMELIKTMAGIDMVHVPCKGSPPKLADLLGGQIAVAFDNLLSPAPLARAGRLRAIAVSTLKRSSAMPEVPSVAEQGLPGFEVAVWQGFLAPAGTPAPVVGAIHSALLRALKRPDTAERMATQGADIIGGTPREFAAFMKTDLVRWAKVVKASGARVD